MEWFLMDPVLIHAEVRAMKSALIRNGHTWTRKQVASFQMDIDRLNKKGLEVLGHLLRERKVTQKEYWEAYMSWADAQNEDRPYWGDEGECDYEWSDELYDKYNPVDPNRTIDDFF